VREYIAENEPLIREIAERAGDGWWTTLKFDIARVNLNSSSLVVSTRGMGNPKAVEASLAYMARQTDTARAFARLEAWMGGLEQRQPGAPVSLADWAALAETYFWAAHLDVDSPLRAWACDVELAPAVQGIPLGVLADVVLALSYGPPAAFEAQVAPHRDRIRERYQRETDTLLIEDFGDTLRAHFIFPFETLNGSAAAGQQEKNPFHAAAIRRIELLRALFPGRDQYGSKGYGHQMGAMVLPIDETNKPAGPVQSLPPRWLPRTNATFRLLANWDRRPATWRDHAQILIELRKSAIAGLKELRVFLLGYMRGQGSPQPWKKIDSNLWERTKTRVQRLPQLPQSAVDEWGFANESMRAVRANEGAAAPRSDPARASQARVGDAYGDYLKALREYTGGLYNFFDQATSVLTVNSPVGRAATSEQAERQRQLAARLGVRTDLGFLSTHNLGEALKHLAAFQLQFRKQVGHLVDPRDLARIESEERNLIPQVWTLWYQFAHAPEQRLRDPQGHADGALREALDGLRRDLTDRLGRLRDEGIEAAILSESLEFDGRPALWVKFDVSDPLELYSEFQLVFEAVQGVLRRVRYRTLELFAVDLAWPAVLIVPVVAGRNLEGITWRFYANSFFEDGEITPDRWWNFVPISLPEGFEAATRIEILRHPRAETIRQLHEAVLALSVRAAHVADLHRLTDDLSGTGEELARAYIERQGEQLGTDLQRVADRFVVALNDRPGDEELAIRPYLQEAIATLAEVVRRIIPRAQEDGNWTIPVAEMLEWVERLQGSLRDLEAVRLLRMADALEQEG
jgi:hypothetical protein